MLRFLPCEGVLARLMELDTKDCARQEKIIYVEMFTFKNKKKLEFKILKCFKNQQNYINLIRLKCYAQINKKNMYI